MPDLSTIPGFSELQSLTKGNPNILVAVLDGSVDLERACFQGANLTKIIPYWQEEVKTHPHDLAIFLEIENNSDLDDETKAEKLAAAIPDPNTRARLHFAFHATHISSTIFGQPGSPVEGIAPNCTGINIPIEMSGDQGEFISPLNLARAFDLALSKGANIIHCAACHPTQTGVSDHLIEYAVRQCQENNVLVIAPGGNDKGECWCIPALLPGVLTVGAMKDNGQPFKFSNWGSNYQSQGILAPGENILGAQPGTDIPVRKKGTSCAAPIITGIAALLLSLQIQKGESINPEAVRNAILNSAIPCKLEEVEEVERCLRGRINIPGAVELLFSGQSRKSFNTSTHINTNNQHSNPNSSSPPGLVLQSIELLQATNVVTDTVISNAVTASAARSNLVYALGTSLSYDFGTEARRDTFKQQMPGVTVDIPSIEGQTLPLSTIVPPNPYDGRQMADYLKQNPLEAKSLIWTLNQELTPIYAVKPVGAFGSDVYKMFQEILAWGTLPKDHEDYIERVSIPGRLTDYTVELFSGQIVPVIEVDTKRGIYAWKVNLLVNAVLQCILEEGTETQQTIRSNLTSFLNRIYYDFVNLGQTSRERALNFAATNTFQAASAFAQAITRGMELDKIEVEKSPVCRLDSDCWEVKLTFFDTENNQRACKIYHFTLDVSDKIPVTLGKMHSWSIPYYRDNT
ncbi:hypothetical protein RIVM261_062760 [Rivularia sp. IAM M-261]|nr:hypothetical protein RIVM261_062760 [Rivularia sp. IAM M-261]